MKNKYKIIENYIKKPKKIYDGCEPKRIMYTIRDDTKRRGKIIGKVDLWGSYNSDDTEIIEGKELKEINKILQLPVEKDYLEKGDEVIAIDLYNDGFPISVEFIRHKDFPDYIIVFIINEKSPSRYQCYIIAVLKEENTEEG